MVKVTSNNIINTGKTVATMGKSKYVLAKKISMHPSSEFIADTKKWGSEVGHGSEYYSYVRISKKDKPEYNREILTFYDSNNQIISRHQTGSDINPQQRTYSYRLEYPETYPITPAAMRRHILTKEWSEAAHEWQAIQEEDQFVYNIKTTKEKIKPKKLHISKNQYNYSEDKTSIKASMTEYPTNCGLGQDTDYKCAWISIDFDKNIPVMRNIHTTSNVNIDLNDEYLPYRFLLGEQKQVSLGYEMLKQNGLDKLGINVTVSPENVPENTSAFFDSYNGNIWFKKLCDTVHPVKVAAHEGDHAKKYALIGQLGKQRSPYEQKAERILGKITDDRERQKAFEYLIASEKYPKISPAEDLTKNEDYINNLLEVSARKTEEKAAKEYNVGRKALQNQFRYVAGENTL